MTCTALESEGYDCDGCSCPSDIDDFSGETCPAMEDGICREGSDLDPDACGYWEDATGERQSNDGRSDDDMITLGYVCSMTCESVDEHHRYNEDNAPCEAVYSTYNDAYNCCPVGAGYYGGYA